MLSASSSLSSVGLEGSLSGSRTLSKADIKRAFLDPQIDDTKPDEKKKDRTKSMKVRSQSLKAFQSSHLRKSIINARNIQDANDAARIVQAREDGQISKAIRNLAKCPSLPLLVNDPFEDTTGLESNDVTEKKKTTSTGEQMMDGLFSGGGSIAESTVSGSIESGSTATLQSGSTKQTPSVVSLKSNNSLPSLISSSNASFPKLGEGSHGSSVYQSFEGVARTVGPKTISDQLYIQRMLEDGKDLNWKANIANWDKNSQMMKAFELTRDAAEVLDPTRILFDAAVLYDDIGLRDKAIKTFNKCIIPCDPAKIVDTYDIPKDIGFERKIERMYHGHRKRFLEERSKLRTELIAAEVERQRLRAMVSHSQLVRLYLLEDDFYNAHQNLLEIFKLTRDASEHTEMLTYGHTVLKEYSNKCFGELSKAQQIVRSSAGPLAEAHLNILHELLEEDARNADVLEWLGRRYAEKCDFQTSFQYYKRSTDMREPARTSNELRDMWIVREAPFDENQFLTGIRKHKRLEYSLYNDIDEANEKNRKDYSWPQKKHVGSTITLYTAPSQGWVYGTVLQNEYFEKKGLMYRLPEGRNKTKTYEE